MGKLSPELREAVLARIAAGSTYEEAADWCNAEHGVKVSKQAIGKLVNRHRSERSEVSKAVTRDHIAKQLPQDLAQLDDKLKAAGELLDIAIKACRDQPTVANFEKYSKANTAYLAHVKRRDEALGLNVPDDPFIDNIVDLFGLELQREEEAAEQAAFPDERSDDDRAEPSAGADGGPEGGSEEA